MEITPETAIYTQAKMPSRSETILVIDDSIDLLNLSRTILELEDYEVLTASCGEDALAILANSKSVSLILLDMRMEDMSGLEFMLELETRMPQVIESVPIVFLTALEKVPESKAIGFIRKPYNMDSLLVAVRGFIENGTKRVRSN